MCTLFLVYRDRRADLSNLDASFAENFYGLKRRRKPVYETERARAATGDMPLPEEKLRPREVSRSLVFLVSRNAISATLVLLSYFTEHA